MEVKCTNARGLFRKWDVDHDGRVTKDDFQRAMREMGFPLNEHALNDLFEILENGGNVIKFNKLDHKLRVKLEKWKQESGMSTPASAPGLSAPQIELPRLAVDGAAGGSPSYERAGSPVELARAASRRPRTRLDRLASPKHPRPIVVAQSIKPRDGVMQIQTGRGGGDVAMVNGHCPGFHAALGLLRSHATWTLSRFSLWDKDGNGTLSFNEFNAMVDSVGKVFHPRPDVFLKKSRTEGPIVSERDMEDLFDCIDVDADNNISHKKLRAAIDQDYIKQVREKAHAEMRAHEEALARAEAAASQDSSPPEAGGGGLGLLAPSGSWAVNAKWEDAEDAGPEQRRMRSELKTSISALETLMKEVMLNHAPVFRT